GFTDEGAQFPWQKLLDGLNRAMDVNARIDAKANHAVLTLQGDPEAVKTLFAFDSVFVTRAQGAFARATSLAQLQDAEWIHTDATDHYPERIRAMFEGE
ncbi:hypothetical protein SB748_30895, partial [Rhizobium sp. SIMBA_035]